MQIKTRKKKKEKLTGYCLSCNEHVVPEKAKRVETSPGKFMLKGVCPDCGRKVNRFLKAGS